MADKYWPQLTHIFVGNYYTIKCSDVCIQLMKDKVKCCHFFACREAGLSVCAEQTYIYL